MITVDEVRRRVAALSAASHFNGKGHIDEDDIRDDVLQAIAGGAPNAAELAAEALKTADYDFPRLYG